MTTPRLVRRRLMLAAGFAAAALALAAALLRSHQPPTPPASAPATPPAGTLRLGAAAQRNAGIATELAASLTRLDHLEAPGVLSLDETHTARIGSVVEGTVILVSAQVGDRVERRQVLAELHSPVSHEAWASYRKAIADFKRATSEVNFALEAAKRAQRLYADKAISLQELQRARADSSIAEQGLETAKIEVRRSQEALEHLGVTSGDDPSGESGEMIPVRSPVAGAVLERAVTAGTAVTPGLPLFVVSDLSTLWAVAEIGETALPHVRVGQPVEVNVAAYPGEAFRGTIVFVADTLDPRTRRASVRCEVPNGDGRLKPQMFATIALGEAAPRKLTAVPAAAVQQLDGKSVVFVATDNETFAVRDIVAGKEVSGAVEVVGGLNPGERVVTAGSFLLKSELLKASAPAEE